MQAVTNGLGLNQQPQANVNAAGSPTVSQSQQPAAGTTGAGATKLSDTPILGGTNGIPVNSQPASGMSNTGSAEKTPTEVVPGTETAPADLASQEGPDGMPNDYVGREIKNPDDLTMKHAGNMGSYRNVGNHENKGIGTNSEPDYAGNTNSSGVTDKTGQPLPGTPMVGTDGEMVGGSMKQSEKGRTKGLYSHAF